MSLESFLVILTNSICHLSYLLGSAMTHFARSELKIYQCSYCLMKHPHNCTGLKPVSFQTQNLYSCVCCCYLHVQGFFFSWALKILNRRHWNSSIIYQKWFFPVDLVSHAAIVKNDVIFKKSQRRWRWHNLLLQHGLSLSCSSTGSGSTDQGEAEELTCDNFCRNFSLNIDNELSCPDSAEWHGWEVHQIRS